VLVLFLQLFASAELASADAALHYARLNALAASTRRDSERAAFLVRRDDGRLGAIAWQPGGTTEAAYRGRIPPGCLAILHTHPAAAPEPSRRDRAESARLRLPIVVITPDRVTAAMPDGSTPELFGPGWTRLDR
jgi:hypothetical protein